MIATEQYPQGLQHTAAEVGLPDDATLVEKSVAIAIALIVSLVVIANGAV